jgi:[ribosomal protein S5]-alanine N-acetyltransferase
MTRVRIATLRAADQSDFLAMTRASRSYHRPWAHPALDPTGFAELLSRAARSDVEAMLVRRIDDDALVGVFVLSQIFRANFGSAYLGYYGSALQAGQGYMSEGLALTLDQAFGPLALHRVEANIQPENTASLRLVERAGFRREGYSPRYLKIAGRWRDHERWAILADEWSEIRRRGFARGGAVGPSA